MNGHETDEADPPSAPPTTPGPLQRPEARWPTALGVVMIVFAGLGLLGGIFGAAANFMDGPFMGTMQDPQMEAFREVQARWWSWNVGVSLLSIVAAGLLLAAGIGLVQRRRWAARLSLIWAGIKIPVELAVTGVTYLVQQETMEAMGGGPMMPGGMEIFTVISVGITLLWGLALPVFVLIWFSRWKIKREVSTWT